MIFHILFKYNLDHGICIGIELPKEPTDIPSSILNILHEDERNHAKSLSPLVKKSWIGGRLALRHALSELNIKYNYPILKNKRGAPITPDFFKTSISHKNTIAIALVNNNNNNCQIGVDIEEIKRTKDDISRLILTDKETGMLSDIDPNDRWFEILLRFSAKEAIYKALDPFVHRFVDFKEVSVTPYENGSFRTDLSLKDMNSEQNKLKYSIDGKWMKTKEFIITSVCLKNNF